MVKTGGWTIPDLVKYLAKQAMPDEEMIRIFQTPAFPKQLYSDILSDQEPPQRFQASELYEPLDAFRELKLPVIDWGTTRWRSSSEGGKSYI